MYMALLMAKASVDHTILHPFHELAPSSIASVGLALSLYASSAPGAVVSEVGIVSALAGLCSCDMSLLLAPTEVCMDVDGCGSSAGTGQLIDLVYRPCSIRCYEVERLVSAKEACPTMSRCG